MPATRLITLNAAAGAFTAITSTVAARRVYAREDEAVAAQGLEYQKPDDGFVNTYVVGTPGSPDSQQIILPDPVGPALPGQGRLLGMPAQGQSGAFNFRAADTYMKVKSKGAGSNVLRLVEIE